MKSLTEALIHKINGPYVGAYEFKNNDPQDGVQPVTIHKDRIPEYYPKLLNQLPANFKGKPPIGVIGPDYDKTEMIKDLNQHDKPIFNPNIHDMGVPEADWEEGDVRTPEEISSMQKRQAVGTAHKIKVPEDTAPEEIEQLLSFFGNPESVETLADSYKHTVNKFQKRYKTDLDGLRKLVSVVQQAKLDLGPEWSTKITRKLSKKDKNIQEPKEKIKKIQRTSDELTALKGSNIEKPAISGSVLPQIIYKGPSGRSVLDMDVLTKIIPLTSSKNIENLEQEDPKLAKELQNKMGEHWKDFMYLGRNAIVAKLRGKSAEQWKQSLTDNPLLTDTGLADLSNISNIVDSIFNSVSTDTIKKSQPIPPEKEAHYHKDNKTYRFSSDDLNQAISDLGTNTVAVIYRDPKKHEELKNVFGPNWATLLTVAQRLNKHKIKGDPDPIGTTAKEYGQVLQNTFGNDWQKNFTKIVNDLDRKADYTQMDASLDKKDKDLNKIIIAYNNQGVTAQSDPRYLKDIALPALMDKSSGYISNLEQHDPKLKQEMESKLGPSWFTLITVAKKAAQDVVKGKDPYKVIIDDLNDDKSLQKEFEKNLGDSYIQTLANIIKAATGIEPPESVGATPPQYQPQNDEVPTRDLAAQGIPTQQDVPAQSNANLPTQPNLPTLGGTQANLAMQGNIDPDPNAQTQQSVPAQNQDQEVPTNPVLPAQTQQDLPVQGDPNAQTQEVPVQNPQEYAAITPDEKPLDNDEAPTRDLNALEPEQERQTDTGVPVPSPVEGDGTIPQSKQDNVDNVDQTPTKTDLDSLPTGVSLPIPKQKPGEDIKYIDDMGSFRTLKADSIVQLLPLEIDSEKERDPEVRKQMKSLLGPQWKRINGIVQKAKYLISNDEDPMNKFFNEYMKNHEQELRKHLGADWRFLITGIVNTVKTAADALKQQQQQEQTPTNPVLPTVQQGQTDQAQTQELPVQS